MSRAAGLGALAALCGALGGCGGGGGDSSAPPTSSSPPAPPPAAITRAEAYRFLAQATFGPTEGEAQRVISLGYSGWIDEQLARPASLQLPRVQAALAALPPDMALAQIPQLHADRVDAWFANAITAPDQLRQRMAFALSEIMVVSQNSALVVLPLATADYYDMLARNAFGDFRRLIEDVTLHPAMGVYLSMLGNQKPDPARNIRPDENYARELMQLFTIGLVELEADGSARLDASGRPIPTYDQAVIEGFAHVYTGWSWAGAPSFALARPTLQNQTRPMQVYAEQHAAGEKRLLAHPGAGRTRIPAGQTPEQDLKDALDNIFHHPNVGPFISRQLIQRLVTSNPSPQYVARVAERFANDGMGRRGDLGAVVRAILLDAEARAATDSDTAGKLAEPLLRLTRLWRAFDARSQSGRWIGATPTFWFGQGPLQAPSVFNFFSPFYAPPGEITERGLVAPEMQLATEYANTLVTNYFLLQAYCYSLPALQVCPPAPDEAREHVVQIDLRNAQPLAVDPQGLVRHVASRLRGAPLAAALEAEVVAAVAGIPATSPGLRVAEALYLVTSSPALAADR